MFQVKLKIPHRDISHRWWEEEALIILWTFDIEEIRRVIRFGIFCDENLPRDTLLSRDADTINNFLIALSDLQEYQNLAKLSHIDRVNEILRRSIKATFISSCEFAYRGVYTTPCRSEKQDDTSSRDSTERDGEQDVLGAEPEIAPAEV